MNKKLAIAVLLGSLTFCEAIELERLKKKKKRSLLPPYFDGVYSNGWRYGHPYWKAMNEWEYRGEEPKPYVAESYAQRNAYGLAQEEPAAAAAPAKAAEAPAAAAKPAAAAAPAKEEEKKEEKKEDAKAGDKKEDAKKEDAKKDDKKKADGLDGEAWTTENFYHYNEKEYREDTPKETAHVAEYKGDALTPKAVYDMRVAENKVNLKDALKEAEEAAHKHQLYQARRVNGITLF
jgi:hypothetical protein